MIRQIDPVLVYNQLNSVAKRIDAIDNKLESIARKVIAPALRDQVVAVSSRLVSASREIKSGRSVNEYAALSEAVHVASAELKEIARGITGEVVGDRLLHQRYK